MKRAKEQENKELSYRVNELLLKNEHLEKDVIEKDKIIVNYR